MDFYFVAIRKAADPVHILTADRPKLFQGIDHSIYSSSSDLRIQTGGLEIDLLTAGAF